MTGVRIHSSIRQRFVLGLSVDSGFDTDTGYETDITEGDADMDEDLNAAEDNDGAMRT